MDSRNDVIGILQGKEGDEFEIVNSSGTEFKVGVDCSDYGTVFLVLPAGGNFSVRIGSRNLRIIILDSDDSGRKNVLGFRRKELLH